MKTHFTNSVRAAFAAVISILVVSCATPQAVIRMNPLSQDVKWNYGQAYVSDTLNGIVVEAAFEKATHDYTIFNIAVVNLSNMSYLADPAYFTFEEQNNDSVSPTIIRALDPETMLLNIDKEMSQSEADAKNLAVGAAVATGALLATAAVVAVSSDNDDDVHYSNHRYADPDLLIAAPLMIETVDDNPESYVAETDRRREFWELSTMRKTTLDPGFKIEGKVIFPRFEKAAIYTLKLPVDNKYIEIPFTQLNFYP